MMTPDELNELKAWWEAPDMKETEGAGVICLHRFMFTYAILAEVERYGYGRRWCYHNYEKAKAAFDAWDGVGEPSGWHRDPVTGRRVGEDGTMYIAF
jgi:hypothetical protein